jgi:hypothetical protein
MRVSVSVCVRAYRRASVYAFASGCDFVRLSVRAFVRACECTCDRGWMRVRAHSTSVRACVRDCKYARVCA